MVRGLPVVTIMTAVCAGSLIVLAAPWASGGSPASSGDGVSAAPVPVSPALAVEAGQGVGGVSTAAALARKGSNESQILAVAQTYLDDQVNSVTESRTSNRSLGTNRLPLDRLTGTLSKTVRQEIPRIEKRRDSWRGTPSEHDWGRATIDDPDIKVLGEVARMTGIERTELHYRSAGPSTFYRVRHEFEFVRRGGAWGIENDTVDSRLLEPYSRPDPVPALITGPVPELDPQGIETPGSRVRGLRAPIGTISNVRMLAPALGPVPYNGNAAADYAVEWALKRNMDYPEFRNDCTNFASQVLRAGGWPDDEDNEWYARGGFFGSFQRKYASTGYTWRLAHNLRGFGIDLARRFREYDGKQARRGDIVFADWDRADNSFGTDGHMDHAMIVTDPGNGSDPRDIRVSYHTTDRLNIRLGEVADIRAAGADPNLQRFYYENPAG